MKKMPPLKKTVFNTKFDLNYDFNGFFVIIPIIVIGLIPVAKILYTGGDYFFR